MPPSIHHALRCLATPCHTQDSICYYVTDTTHKSQPGRVFTGDTLFIAGCGRFFEGTGEEMNAALSYLGTLPNETIVQNGHEYTKSSLAFAKSVDPTNKAIETLEGIVKQNTITTGLTTIGDEKEWNVFMRLGSEAVRFVSLPSFYLLGHAEDTPCGLLYTYRKATGSSADTPESSVIDKLREQKNKFKG